MKIAVSSQNRFNITGHAGKASRFWIYSVNDADHRIISKDMVELPREDILHVRFHESTNPYAQHPVLDADIIITGSAGNGFINKMKGANVGVAITSEKNPDAAINKLLNDALETINPEDHCNCH